ncbi:MAG: hypothetical protein IPJ65_22055 [Archangiaceae bacterium]|nr:hypothetical protein [Archangiaceae bacterium]
MRLPAVLLVAVCATPREPGGSPALPPPAQAVARAEPLQVETAPCPLQPAVRGTPGCRFEPVAARGRGLVSAARFNCALATTPAFIDTSLLLTATFVEGNSGYGLQLLREPDGGLRVAPATLSNPALLRGKLVGFAGFHDHRVFWNDGVCELLPGGELEGFATLGDAELVMLQKTPEYDYRLLLRAADGRWSVLPQLPRAVEPWLRSAGGRVAVMATNTQPFEWQVLLPDLSRTVMLRRTEGTDSNRPRASSPLPAAGGSRFSTAVTVHPGGDEKWYLRWPGTARLELPIPTEQTACSEASRPDGYRRTQQPAVLALSAHTALVTWLEERGRCQYTHVAKEPVRCLPNQPCIDTEPAHWEVHAEPTRAEVVVLRVEGRDLDEVSRVRLEAPAAQYVFGSSIAATPGRVLVQAWGHLLELERATLEGK